MSHSDHSFDNHDYHSNNMDIMATTISPFEEEIHDHQSLDHDFINRDALDNTNMDHEAMGHNNNHHMNADDTGMNHMMSMAFHFGYTETILFSWWKIDGILGLLFSMLVIFIMAVLYEGLKYYREYLFWKTYNLLEYRPVTGPQRNRQNPTRTAATSTASPVQYVGEVMHKQPPTMFSMHHLFQTLLHIIQVTLSFLLMLIFMTFNVWLCMAVVLGATVGYFLFCWKKSVIVDVTEHCH